MYVAISVFTCQSQTATRLFCEQLKSRFPAIKIILGGQGGAGYGGYGSGMGGGVLSDGTYYNATSGSNGSSASNGGGDGWLLDFIDYALLGALGGAIRYGVDRSIIS